MIIVLVSKQGEDIMEHTNGKCHVCYNFGMQEEDIF